MTFLGDAHNGERGLRDIIELEQSLATKNSKDATRVRGLTRRPSEMSVLQKHPRLSRLRAELQISLDNKQPARRTRRRVAKAFLLVSHKPRASARR